jgi:hypothetical protein
MLLPTIKPGLNYKMPIFSMDKPPICQGLGRGKEADGYEEDEGDEEDDFWIQSDQSHKCIICEYHK